MKEDTDHEYPCEPPDRTVHPRDRPHRLPAVGGRPGCGAPFVLRPRGGRRRLARHRVLLGLRLLPPARRHGHAAHLLPRHPLPGVYRQRRGGLPHRLPAPGRPRRQPPGRPALCGLRGVPRQVQPARPARRLCRGGGPVRHAAHQAAGRRQRAGGDAALRRLCRGRRHHPGGSHYQRGQRGHPAGQGRLGLPGHPLRRVGADPLPRPALHGASA